MMDTATANPKDLPNAAQHAIADTLLSLLPNGYLKKHADKKLYITLDEQVGKSQNHKNAVGIFRNEVRFRVGDWKLLADATVLGLTVKQREKDSGKKSIVFPSLDENAISANRDFFKELLLEAKRESQRRQGENRFSFQASDITSITVDGNEVYAKGKWSPNATQD
jgi:hypothetical protein